VALYIRSQGFDGGAGRRDVVDRDYTMAGERYEVEGVVGKGEESVEEAKLAKGIGPICCPKARDRVRISIARCVEEYCDE
jgi:hypothetical protein